MIDLPTQKQMSSPHHRRAVWALIGAGLLLAGVLAGYYTNTYMHDAVGDSTSPPTTPIVGGEVPQANLTAAEQQKLQSLAGKPVPSANLTKAQLEALKKLQVK